MNPRVTRRRVPRACRDLVVLLSAIVGGDPNLCANAHPVAFCSYELQKNPVIGCFSRVPKYAYWVASRSNYNIDSAIIVQIAVSQSPIRRRPHAVGAGSRAYTL